MTENERSLEVSRQALQSPGTSELISRGLRDLTRPLGRTLRFPPGKSYGSVHVRPRTEGLAAWPPGPWRRIGDAEGEVQIPANQDVLLECHGNGVLIASLSDEELGELEQLPGVYEQPRVDGGRYLHFPTDENFDLSFLQPGDLEYLGVQRELDDAYLDEEDFQALRRLTDLKGLSLSGQDVSGTRLEALRNMHRLEELHLVSASFTDDDLQNIGRLITLRMLSLCPAEDQEGKFTDAGMIWLQDLVEMRELDLSGARVTNEGISYLQGLVNLEWIDLSATLVSDGGLWYLRNARHLRVLNLGYNMNISDGGLRHLAEFPLLERLELHFTHVSDAGLRHIVEIASLEELILDGTRITPKGVGVLSALPNLRRLDLRIHMMSEPAIRSLEQALPYCTINSWGSPF